MSSTLIITNARAVTLAGDRPKRGRSLGELGIVPRAEIQIEGGVISSVKPMAGPLPGGEHVIDAAGRVVMPAFIDCHTHACWAGDRLDEWQMKLRGVSYLEILKSGGGIMSTVRSVRKASEEELLDLLRRRLAAMVRAGSSVVEVKSGYGLTTDAELKMLRVIRRAAEEALRTTGQRIIATALLGHAIDSDVPGFVDRVIEETLPAVHAEFPGVTIDAFCEQGAWLRAETVRLFETARGLGHPIRVHADQFNSLGMIGEAVRLGAVSVDHLEASTTEDLRRLAESETAGVALPACGFHVDGRYAQVREFVDRGGILALATNFNPGSAPTPSMSMAIALAARHCGLTPHEAIAAATVNAAHVLRQSKHGQIAPGCAADLIMLHTKDERDLAYEFGGGPIAARWIDGHFVQPT